MAKRPAFFVNQEKLLVKCIRLNGILVLQYLKNKNP